MPLRARCRKKKKEGLALLASEPYLESKYPDPIRKRGLLQLQKQPEIETTTKAETGVAPVKEPPRLTLLILEIVENKPLSCFRASIEKEEAEKKPYKKPIQNLLLMSELPCPYLYGPARPDKNVPSPCFHDSIDPV